MIAVNGLVICCICYSDSYVILVIGVRWAKLLQAEHHSVFEISENISPKTPRKAKRPSSKKKRKKKKKYLSTRQVFVPNSIFHEIPSKRSG